MNIRIILLAFICGISISTAVVADDHATAEQRPVEIWTCSFNDGKSATDLDAWYVDFNSFADSMTNSGFSSYMLGANLRGSAVRIWTGAEYLPEHPPPAFSRNAEGR